MQELLKKGCNKTVVSIHTGQLIPNIKTKTCIVDIHGRTYDTVSQLQQYLPVIVYCLLINISALC